MKRDIKKEMMTLKGSEFKSWYNTLSKDEKVEYAFILEDLKNTPTGGSKKQ